MDSPQQKQVNSVRCLLSNRVKLFYVPFRCRDFTESLLQTVIDRIKGNDYSKILFLAPTPRKIKNTQKIFHKLAKDTYIPPEMMTIKQFSKKLYYLYGDKTLISESLIPIIISRLSGKSIGFSSIISNFIEEIKQHRPDKDIGTIQTELRDAFAELNVPEQGSKRAMDAIEIFREYQELLNQHNALDENDVLIKCPELIERDNYTPETLIIDGFYEVTPVEWLILKKLIEHSRVIFILIPYDANFAEITNSFENLLKNNFNIDAMVLTPNPPLRMGGLDLSYISYPGIDEEVEGIARHIKNLFISGKYKSLDNIILTVPKLDIYSDLIQRVFRRYGIPCAFSISKPVGKTRPFLDLIAMLESVADDYPRLPFSSFLISPYFKKLPDIFRKWMPQISLNSGIIKGKKSWLSRENRSYMSYKTYSEIEKELRWIFKKLAPLESIKDTGTNKQFCEALHKLAAELDFSDPVKNLPNRVDLKEQITDILKELSLIDKLILIPPRIPLRQFIDCLKHLLNATKTEIEGTGVQVVEFFELRGMEPEYLYFGGLKDGDIPSRPEIDHIFPDSVRTRLGLVNMKRYLYLQKFIFQHLVDSSKYIHLSYPAMEADRLFLPSPFLLWKAETKENITGILSREEGLLKQGKTPLSSHIKEIVNLKNKAIKKQFEENSHIRVTDIDYYRMCPRRFFIERILSLEPSEIKEYRIEAILLGTIVHQIMEDLITKPFKNFDEMRLNAEELLKKILNEQPIEDYWKNLIRDSFLYILPEIYEIEDNLINEGYSFMDAEVPVEGEVVKGIKLKGKIDRIDRKVKSEKSKVRSSEDNEVQLIDYKTGIALFNRTEILSKGANLQLFLYAALMKSLGIKVDRIGVYSLKDINITWVPGKNDKREGRTIDDYIKASLKYLEETLLKMRKGDFIASPLNEYTCHNCHEKPFCPYIQTFS